MVSKFLGFLTIVICACMLCPFAYAVATGGEDVVPFAKALAAGIAAAAGLLVLGHKAKLSKMGTREALAMVSLSWVVASAVSGLPYWFHGAAPTYTDAFFESMSGYTTTGATILADIDDVPRGLVLWRGLTHWLGGMGIIVLTLTVMPLTGIGGFQLFQAEVPGMTPERFTPRIRQTAVILWLTYVALTLVQALLLLIGGMDFYEALTYAIGAVSTGGFSPNSTSIQHFDSSYVDWIVTLFMFVSGVNFALYFRAIKGRALRTFFRDPEFRFYLATALTFSILVSLGLYGMTSLSFANSLRYGFFQVVSFMTTTGFVSMDYDAWPFFCKALLFLCLFMGACAGSTSGGIKQIRLLVLVRHAKRQITRILSPRAVVPLRVGDKSVDAGVVSSCLAFLGLYAMVYVTGVFLITLYEPDLFTAIAGVATTLGNVGPGFGSLGATGTYASQATGAKWIYSFLMLCGRLELYSVLVLFTRTYWSGDTAACRRTTGGPASG